MVKYVLSNDSISKDILYALGIDGRGVTSFTLSLAAGDFAKVAIERILPESDAVALKEILEEYRLEKK